MCGDQSMVWIVLCVRQLASVEFLIIGIHFHQDVYTAQATA